MHVSHENTYSENFKNKPTEDNGLLEDPDISVVWHFIWTPADSLVLSHVAYDDDDPGALKVTKVWEGYVGYVDDADLPEVTVRITGDGYEETFTLDEGNTWTV